MYRFYTKPKFNQFKFKNIFRSLLLFTVGLTITKNQMGFLPRLNLVLAGMENNAVITVSLPVIISMRGNSHTLNKC